MGGGNGVTPSGNKLLIPNTTQVPNVLLDEVIPKLTSGPVRVLLAIIRLTYGFQKSSDRISQRALAKKTGLSRRRVIDGVKSLGNIIKVTPGKKGLKTWEGANEYSLNLDISTGQLDALCSAQNVTRAQNVTCDGNSNYDVPKTSHSQTNKIKPIRRPHSGDAKSPSPGHKETMFLYCELFSAKFGSKPHVVGGKDGKLLSDLLRQHPPHEVQETLRLFFKKPPDWVARQSNYTIGAFAKCFTQLLAMKADRHARMRGGFVG